MKKNKGNYKRNEILSQNGSEEKSLKSDSSLKSKLPIQERWKLIKEKRSKEITQDNSESFIDIIINSENRVNETKEEAKNETKIEVKNEKKPKVKNKSKVKLKSNAKIKVDNESKNEVKKNEVNETKVKKSNIVRSGKGNNEKTLKKKNELEKVPSEPPFSNKFVELEIDVQNQDRSEQKSKQNEFHQKNNVEETVIIKIKADNNKPVIKIKEEVERNPILMKTSVSSEERWLLTQANLSQGLPSRKSVHKKDKKKNLTSFLEKKVNKKNEPTLSGGYEKSDDQDIISNYLQEEEKKFIEMSMSKHQRDFPAMTMAAVTTQERWLLTQADYSENSYSRSRQKDYKSVNIPFNTVIKYAVFIAISALIGYGSWYWMHHSPNTVFNLSDSTSSVEKKLASTKDESKKMLESDEESADLYQQLYLGNETQETPIQNSEQIVPVNNVIQEEDVETTSGWQLIKPQISNSEKVIYHTVKSGDSPYKISSNYYGTGDYAQYIMDFNNIKDPSSITEGMKLKIPEKP